MITHRTVPTYSLLSLSFVRSLPPPLFLIVTTLRSCLPTPALHSRGKQGVSPCLAMDDATKMDRATTRILPKPRNFVAHATRPRCLFLSTIVKDAKNK